MAKGGQTMGQASYARTISKVPPGSLAPVKKVSLKKVKKKMGWFRKKFNGWVRQAWNDARDEEMADTVIKADYSISGKTSVRFTVYPASGGYVIEHYKHDRYRESEGPELTIVNHGDDLGKAVEHIIALEALKS